MIGLNSHPIQLTITWQLVQEVVHTRGITLTKGNLGLLDKRILSSKDCPVFETLKHEHINLWLQLYMHFFGMTHLTRAKDGLALHIGISKPRYGGSRLEWSPPILNLWDSRRKPSFKHKWGKEASEAKKNLPLALVAPLVLAHIVYYAMDAIHHLLPPLCYDPPIPFQLRTFIFQFPK